jgi:hypothetical protein
MVASEASEREPAVTAPAADEAARLAERYAELSTELRQMVWDKIQVTNPRYVRPYTSPDGSESTDGESSTGE